MKGAVIDGSVHLQRNAMIEKWIQNRSNTWKRAKHWITHQLISVHFLTQVANKLSGLISGEQHFWDPGQSPSNRHSGSQAWPKRVEQIILIATIIISTLQFCLANFTVIECQAGEKNEKRSSGGKTERPTLPLTNGFGVKAHASDPAHSGSGFVIEARGTRTDSHGRFDGSRALELALSVNGLRTALGAAGTLFTPGPGRALNILRRRLEQGQAERMNIRQGLITNRERAKVYQL